jgi:hypothetical protein
MVGDLMKLEYGEEITDIKLLEGTRAFRCKWADRFRLMNELLMPRGEFRSIQIGMDGKFDDGEPPFAIIKATNLMVFPEDD